MIVINTNIDYEYQAASTISKSEHVIDSSAAVFHYFVMSSIVAQIKYTHMCSITQPMKWKLRFFFQAGHISDQMLDLLP